jgi:flavin reductase (NADH)
VIDDEADRGVGRIDQTTFREAMSRWASGVAVVAVRDPDDGRVYATTATAFSSASLDPPLVLVGLGAGAQVLPFMEEHRPFGVSLLAATQRRWATLFADPYPVGPSPFPPGTTLLPDALVGIGCVVHDRFEIGDHRFVAGLVTSASDGRSDEPLIHYSRGYRSLGS